MFTCYVPDNPWLASLHTTSKDQGQVGANESRKHSSSSPHRHHTGLSELRGKKQQQPTIYNLAWRDAHARTTQESHLARAMRDLRRVRRASLTANRLVQHYTPSPPNRNIPSSEYNVVQAQQQQLANEYIAKNTNSQQNKEQGGMSFLPAQWQEGGLIFILWKFPYKY